MTTDYSQVPIIQCAYQFTLEAHQTVARFPKHLRFQLGVRIIDGSQEFMERVIKANFIRDPRIRAEALSGLAELLFTSRMNIRLAKDLKAIPLGHAAQLTLRLEDLQKQLTGWLTWTRSKMQQASHSSGAGTRVKSEARPCT